MVFCIFSDLAGACFILPLLMFLWDWIISYPLYPCWHWLLCLRSQPSQPAGPWQASLESPQACLVPQVRDCNLCLFLCRTGQTVPGEL